MKFSSFHKTKFVFLAGPPRLPRFLNLLLAGPRWDLGRGRLSSTFLPQTTTILSTSHTYLSNVMIRTTLTSSRTLPQTLVLRGVRHASVQRESSSSPSSLFLFPGFSPFLTSCILAATPAPAEDGGSIMDAFASTSIGAQVLPQRFSDLKKKVSSTSPSLVLFRAQELTLFLPSKLWHPSLETRWKEVLTELEVETKRIVTERDGGKEVSRRRIGRRLRRFGRLTGASFFFSFPDGPSTPFLSDQGWSHRP